MDIVLVNPADLITPYPPMGLVELGTFLERKGYSVAVVDFSLTGEKEGLSKVASLKPKIVGISILFGVIRQAARIAESIKKALGCTLIAGGYYPTFKTLHCLNNLKAIDFAVLGEGETPTLQLLYFLLRKIGNISSIDGLAYRRDGAPVVHPVRELIDLKTLPLPNLSLIDLADYPKKNGKRVFTVSTSRGCNYGCSFCSQCCFWQGTVRFQHSDAVIETIGQAVKEQGAEYVRILDDNFIVRESIFTAVASYLKSTGLPWECQARADLLDPEILRLLADCHLDRLFIGLESASQKTQRVFGKRIDLSRASEMIKEARRLKIRVKVSFQIGAPGEDKGDIEETIKFASALEVDEIALFLTTPFPGTEIEQIAIQRGLLSPDAFLDLDPSTPSMGTGPLSKDEVLAAAEEFIDRVKNAQWGHHSRKGRQQALRGD